MYTAPNKADPVDRLAHFLSEWLNDSAPIGWERYRAPAKDLIEKLDIAEVVKERLCE